MEEKENSSLFIRSARSIAGPLIANQRVTTSRTRRIEFPRARLRGTNNIRIIDNAPIYTSRASERASRISLEKTRVRKRKSTRARLNPMKRASECRRKRSIRQLRFCGNCAWWEACRRVRVSERETERWRAASRLLSANEEICVMAFCSLLPPCLLHVNFFFFLCSVYLMATYFFSEYFINIILLVITFYMKFVIT